MTLVLEHEPVDEVDYRRFLAALLSGDRQSCRMLFSKWVNEHREIRWLYEQILQRALYEVGLRWERGEVSVATEHLATAIAESLLNMVYPRLFARPSAGRSVVVTCAANEYHQIGGKMVADLFAWHGWRSYFLGANTPCRDLLELIREKQPDAVAFSLTVPYHLPTLTEALQAVRRSFPDLPILAGGQAFRQAEMLELPAVSGVLVMETLDQLETWIDGFRA